MSKAKSGVVLKNNRSASGIFHEVLSLVCDQIDPTPRLQEWLISADSFRKHYVSRLPEFEAHRLCSPQRHAIARQLSKAVGRETALVRRDQWLDSCSCPE